MIGPSKHSMNESVLLNANEGLIVCLYNSNDGWQAELVGGIYGVSGFFLRKTYRTRDEALGAARYWVK